MHDRSQHAPLLASPASQTQSELRFRYAPRRLPNSDWGAAAVRSAQPATNNPFASPDVPETAPVDGFGDSAFGAAPPAGDGAAADGGFGESAFGEKPAFGAVFASVGRVTWA